MDRGLKRCVHYDNVTGKTYLGVQVSNCVLIISPRRTIERQVQCPLAHKKDREQWTSNERCAHSSDSMHAGKASSTTLAHKIMCAMENVVR